MTFTGRADMFDLLANQNIVKFWLYALHWLIFSKYKVSFRYWFKIVHGAWKVRKTGIGYEKI